MLKYKISVALVTYNGDKYLNEQLESILNQTVKPDELIVVDDCSTDYTISIINDFKDRVPFEVNLIQ